MKRVVFFLGILALMGFAYAVPAYNNLHLNIQTTFSNGSIQTGTFAFVFNISDSSDCASGNIVYSNSTTLATDARGIISYYLPNVTLDYSTQYWLCYYKDGVLTDTSELARVPYAFEAKNTTVSGLEVDKNLEMGSYNATAAHGLFNYLGNYLSPIVEMIIGGIQFSGEINGSGNITTTGNVSAAYFYGNGSHLTGISTSALETDPYWTDNFTKYNSTWSSITNTSYYLATNPFGFYNSTTLPTTGGSGVPTGAISAFNLASCPTGWVLADGTSGTPDLRGIFIRGSGTNSILKYANGSYFSKAYGTYGNDSFQGHYHKILDSVSNSPSIFTNFLQSGSNNAAATWHTWNANDFQAKDIFTDGTSGTPRVGNETTPAYYATIYCVKTSEDTPVSNTIWGTSGFNAFVQNTSLNVGIGTTTPQAKLDINTSSSAAGVIIESNSSSSGTPIPRLGLVDAFSNPANSSLAWYLENYATNFRISTQPNISSTGSVKFFINGSSGNVGIGTSSPTSKLSVTGAESTSTGISVDGGFSTGLYALAGEAGGGGVGVQGETDVSYSQGVYGYAHGAQSTTGVYGLATGSSSIGVRATGETWDFYAANSSAKNYFAGNVGINTTTPQNTLNVAGTANITSTTYMGNPTYIYSALNVNGTGNAASFMSGGIAQNATSDINFGEGSDPFNYRMGVLRYRNGAGTASLSKIQLFSYGGTENQLVLVGNGNIGIGISSPAHLLDVGTNDAALASSTVWISRASDSRLKTNISSFTDGMNIISQINPINYNFNGITPEGNDTTNKIGLFADQLNKIAPYMAVPRNYTITQQDMEIINKVGIDAINKNTPYPLPKNIKVNDTIQLYGWDANALNFIFVNAFKEQQNEIIQQNNTINSQQVQINDLKKALCEIKPELEMCK